MKKVFIDFDQRKASPLPDAANLVAIRLIVVVRVAIVQVHVPGVSAIVLRRRPKVVGRLAKLSVTDLSHVTWLHPWRAG